MRHRRLFGDRDWGDVRTVVVRRMRRRFPRAHTEDIEDAVSLAMVDLVDYWVQLESSIREDEPSHTFWLACKRATWMATTFLTQEWDMRDTPFAFVSDETGSGLEQARSQGRGRASESPEDIVIQNLERERFQGFIANLPDRLNDWLRPFMAGVTTRQQARIEGCSQQAVAARWQRNLRTTVQLAEECGFGGAAS